MDSIKAAKVDGLGGSHGPQAPDGMRARVAVPNSLSQIPAVTAAWLFGRLIEFVEELLTLHSVGMTRRSHRRTMMSAFGDAGRALDTARIGSTAQVADTRKSLDSLHTHGTRAGRARMADERVVDALNRAPRGHSGPR